MLHIPCIASVQWRSGRLLLNGKELASISDPAQAALVGADLFHGRSVVTKLGPDAIRALIPVIDTTDFWHAVSLRRAERLAVERGELTIDGVYAARAIADPGFQFRRSSELAA
jgi:hypothetical protein